MNNQTLPRYATCKNVEMSAGGHICIKRGFVGDFPCVGCLEYKPRLIQPGDFVYKMEEEYLDKGGNTVPWRYGSYYIQFIFKRFFVYKIEGKKLFDFTHEIRKPKRTILEAVESAGYCGLFNLKLARVAEAEYAKADPRNRNLWLTIYFNRDTGKLGLTLESVKDEENK